MIKRILTDDDLSKINKTIETIEKSGLESNKILVENLKSKEVEASTNDDLRTNVKKVADIKVGSKVPLKATNDLISLSNINNESIELKWSSPSNVAFEGITITEFKEDILVRNTSRYPRDINDGIKLGSFYRNQHRYTPFVDRNVRSNTKYYYSVFSVSKNGLITKSGTTTIILETEIPIKQLPIGALVQDSNSKYYGKPIVWMKLADNHPGYPKNSTTLITEKIISVKIYDGSEPSNPDERRSKRGNSRYIYSNIRQWLNSSLTNWYSPQHKYDAPPTKENTYWGEHNPYFNEKGFMANLTPNLRNSILTTSLKALKHEKDGGGIDSFTDKIFLLSCTETGLDNKSSYSEGVKFDYFKGFLQLRAYPTKEAVDNSDYTSSYLSDSKHFRWWLRTSSPNGEYGFVYGVGGDGFRSAPNPNQSNGVRPALNINFNSKVSAKPNSDGIYEFVF